MQPNEVFEVESKAFNDSLSLFCSIFGDPQGVRTQYIGEFELEICNHKNRKNENKIKGGKLFSSA
jgi:hypothetical protein